MRVEQYLTGERLRMMRLFLDDQTRKPTDGFVLATAREHPDYDFALARTMRSEQLLKYSRGLLGLDEKGSAKDAGKQEEKRWSARGTPSPFLGFGTGGPDEG